MRSYANVVATLPLFLSLGGGAYAAVTITGRNVANGTLTGKDVRNETIRSADVGGLRVTDFAPGQIPACPKGDRGHAGAPAASGPGARVRMTARATALWRPARGSTSSAPCSTGAPARLRTAFAAPGSRSTASVGARPATPTRCSP